METKQMDRLLGTVGGRAWQHLTDRGPGHRPTGGLHCRKLLAFVLIAVGPVVPGHGRRTESAREYTE